MLNTLMRAIAQLLRFTTKHTEATPVQPTQTAGRAPQVRTPRAGNKPSVQTTKRQPASKKPKRKSSLAQADTTATLRKPRQKPAQQMSGEIGLQQAIPASQPASKSAKRKPSVAQSTTAVASRKPASKPVQTTSGKRGRPRKTPV